MASGASTRPRTCCSPPAASAGLVSVVAVLGSLYPVVTVALAATLLHERLGRLQAAGAAVALVGVAMIAAG